MGPFDLWPVAGLAWLLGYVLGAAIENQSLTLIWKRRGPGRFILCSIKLLLIVGALTALAYVFVAFGASFLWNDSARLEARIAIVMVGFALLLGLATWGTAALVRYFAVRSYRRVVVEIQDS